MIASVADLPFCERPVSALLHLAEDRAAPDPDYVGFGWGRAKRLWLAEPGAPPLCLDDALLLALHCPDDGEALRDDVELYFELPGEQPVTVLASTFLARWLPRLPRDVSSVVLALCNPHRAVLPPLGDLPFHFAEGEVESWISRDDGRIELRARRWRRAGSKGGAP